MDRERLKRDVERIEKHRKEKAEVAKSEREIFAALKGDGFNCKVVREIIKRRAMGDSSGWDAEVATYEAAMQSLELAAGRVREGATYEQAATEHNVRKADLHHFVQATAVPETEITEHDPETGEIKENAHAEVEQRTAASTPQGGEATVAAECVPGADRGKAGPQVDAGPGAERSGPVGRSAPKDVAPVRVAPGPQDPIDWDAINATHPRELAGSRA